MIGRSITPYTYSIDRSTLQIYESELMSGTESREWVHQKPTKQPTDQRLVDWSCWLFTL